MVEVIEASVIAQELKAKVNNLQLLKCQLLDNYDRMHNYSTLKESQIKDVYSYGKKVVIELDTQLIVISFGMTGKIVFDKRIHNHVQFTTTELEFYFNDARRFGFIDVVESIEKDKFFATKMGPCLYSRIERWFGKYEWRNILKPKLLRRKIIDILTDQKVIAGIGNYLVSDILYLSKISPLRIGNTLTKREIDRLRRKTLDRLLSSKAAGGFTIQDYETPDGNIGIYKPLIYGRDADDLGNEVVHVTKGNRTFHYVESIQI